MKKILIARDLLEQLDRKHNFLNRTDIAIFGAASSDELLKIHSAEHADLIIAHLDMPGISVELMCSRLREDAALRSVQIIMVCANSRTAIEHASRCRPNAVILRPLNPGILLTRAQQLLTIAWRETSRVLITVAVQGRGEGAPFFCHSQDLSLSGMLIETDRKLEKGARISCSFLLPDGVKLTAAGDIVRAVAGRDGTKGMNQYGVKFLQMSTEERNVLEEFINTKSLHQASH